MDQRAKLLEVWRHTASVVRAAEDWQPSYRKDRATFKRLIDQEVLLEQHLAEYFHGLAAMRISNLLNWQEVTRQIRADVIKPQNDPAWATEVAMLTGSVYDDILELIVTGGQAGEVIYSSPIGISSISEMVQLAARDRVAELVTQVSSTTRDQIRQSIKTSIAQGEDLYSTTQRLREVIDNPVRAELIARTESVNAYQIGLRNFAVETGAKTKTWESLSGACVVCAPLNGKTVGLNEQFTSRIGDVDHPPQHPRCKCGIIYGY